ncbi:MAG: hypothetical protein AAF999_04390 [Pseudomonadota bacterium]
MFIVSPSTLYNRDALETRTVPKRMIGRISLIPRRGATARMIVRLVFEVQVLRYLIALLPFVIAMFIWPDLALPISQAPIPMLLVIFFVETRVLTIPREKRDQVMTEDEMDRVLDALQFNAKRILTRIAARKSMKAGQLLLVVEQSELARVSPLSLVSVQTDVPKPLVLDLDDTEQAMMRDGLFDAGLSEANLHRVTLRSGRNLHSVTIETSEISAHARMAAIAPLHPLATTGMEVAQ